MHVLQVDTKRQKLLGLKTKDGKAAGDEAVIADLAIKPNTKVMMMGQPEAVIAQAEAEQLAAPEVQVCVPPWGPLFTEQGRLKVLTAAARSCFFYQPVKAQPGTWRQHGQMPCRLRILVCGFKHGQMCSSLTQPPCVATRAGI